VNPTSRPWPTRLALLAGLADLVATRQQALPRPGRRRRGGGGRQNTWPTSWAPCWPCAAGRSSVPASTASVDLAPTATGAASCQPRATGSTPSTTRTDQPRPAPLLLAPPDAVLVFDGVFLLRPQLNNAWDLRIFLEVDFQEALGCPTFGLQDMNFGFSGSGCYAPARLLAPFPDGPGARRGVPKDERNAG
jgi:hypothetical protein